MFEVTNISIMVSTRYLIKGLSFTLNKGDKLAIIGEEGNGKSTLLKALLGICEYAEVTGSISAKNNRIGYLEQSISEDNLQQTGFDFLFLKDHDQYYQKSAVLYKYLKDLKLQDTILQQELKQLSGGEKVKLGILKLLLEECDIFFLDEPTNDLDIETLNWLENFIKNTDCPILYVSHDETLLANTANQILHIEQRKHKTECSHSLWKIDYETYRKDREASLFKQSKIAQSEQRKFRQKQQILQQVMQKVEYQQNTITRKDPHGAKLLKKKMHTLKSQEKRLNATTLTQRPDVEEEIYCFFEPVDLPPQRQLLKIEIPELKVQERTLAKNLKLEVRGAEHIVILGRNGIGKTTLLKEIYKAISEKENSGNIIGYMPQNYEDIFHNYEDVLTFLVPHKTKEELTKARTYLGNMKFTKEEMTGKIDDLSNGSKAKLFLTKFILQKCNILLLDEPTRNISPLSNPVIRHVLKNFQGAIISISHDRKYIEEVADCIYVFTEDGLKRKDFFEL